MHLRKSKQFRLKSKVAGEEEDEVGKAFRYQIMEKSSRVLFYTVGRFQNFRIYIIIGGTCQKYTFLDNPRGFNFICLGWTSGICIFNEYPR